MVLRMAFQNSCSFSSALIIEFKRFISDIFTSQLMTGPSLVLDFPPLGFFPVLVSLIEVVVSSSASEGIANFDGAIASSYCRFYIDAGDEK